jgi:hypothetical protein
VSERISSSSKLPADSSNGGWRDATTRPGESREQRTPGMLMRR